MDNIISGCVLNLLFWLIILPLTILIATPFIWISAFMMRATLDDDDEETTYWHLVLQGYRKACRVWLDMLGFC